MFFDDVYTGVTEDSEGNDSGGSGGGISIPLDLLFILAVIGLLRIRFFTIDE